MAPGLLRVLPAALAAELPVRRVFFFFVAMHTRFRWTGETVPTKASVRNWFDAQRTRAGSVTHAAAVTWRCWRCCVRHALATTRADIDDFRRSRGRSRRPPVVVVKAPVADRKVASRLHPVAQRLAGHVNAVQLQTSPTSRSPRQASAARSMVFPVPELSGALPFGAR
jgi:hypothetical protein